MKDSRLLQFVQRCANTTTPDLHSFTIEIENGKAFVECLYGDIIVDVVSFGSPEGHQQFRGDVNGATAYLIGRGARFETIEQ